MDYQITVWLNIEMKVAFFCHNICGLDNNNNNNGAVFHSLIVKGLLINVGPPLSHTTSSSNYLLGHPPYLIFCCTYLHFVWGGYNSGFLTLVKRFKVFFHLQCRVLGSNPAPYPDAIKLPVSHEHPEPLWIQGRPPIQVGSTHLASKSLLALGREMLRVPGYYGSKWC